MRQQSKSPYSSFLKATVPFLSLFAINCLSLAILSINQSSKAEVLTQNDELYENFEGNEKKNTLLDVSNPMELMNLLRKATAMDNATNPSDAIDQALRSLQEESQEVN